MEIENLRRATLADLRSKFRELFQELTPCRHRELLLRRIAWRLQALAVGDLTDRARTLYRSPCLVRGRVGNLFAPALARVLRHTAAAPIAA
jgi:hypothetical protein